VAENQEAGRQLAGKKNMAFPSVQTSPSGKILPCKICAAPSPVYGAVDFNKNCEERGAGRIFPKSDILIGYHKCPGCGFLFTPAFDEWTHKEYAQAIYNDDYILVDPDYRQARPAANAALLTQMFGRHMASLSLLDYGGGNGFLADTLVKNGFGSAATYDPFNPEFAELPGRKFNIVSCFETLEHVPDPHSLTGTIAQCVENNGLVIFSTLIQPPHFEKIGLAWWYLGPRNGHISLYTPKALGVLWGRQGFKFGSLNPNVHIAFRKLPDFAQHLMRA
jgi:hypothetical protein